MVLSTVIQSLAKLHKASLFLLVALIPFLQCTKPTIHYLRPIVLVTPDSRELFGCRINGIPYSPQASDSASLRTCYYTQVYSGDSGYVFSITGNRFETACEFFSVTIMLDSSYLRRGKAYRLGTPGAGKNYGAYFMNTVR